MKRVRRIVLMLVVLAMGIVVNKHNAYAASVTASNYSELKKHLNSTTKDTITITKDIEITGQIKVNGNKKIIGKNHLIYRAKSFTTGRLLDVQKNVTLEVQGLRISGKKIKSSYGLIRVLSQGKLVLDKNTKITDSNSTNSGGAIENSGTVKTSATINNNVCANYGGAIYNRSGANLSIEAGNLAYNSAKHGGAVYVDAKGSASFSGGKIYRNTCTGNGQAIYAGKLSVSKVAELGPSNDIYVPAAGTLSISNFNGKYKLMINIGKDVVGTRISPNGAAALEKVGWSKNFKNPKKHIIVSYKGGLYVGRYIKITFHTEKGESCPTQTKTIKWGQSYGSLPTAARTGYNFAGWTTAKNSKSYVKSSTEVKLDADVTLYPAWTPKVVDVKFHSNGGNAVSKVVKATYNQALAGLPVPTRTGYTFAGWFTSATGGTQYKNGSLSNFISSTTLYAHWQPVKITITLDPMGGTIAKKVQERYYDQTVGTLGTPVRSGYKFLGWSFSKTTNNFINSSQKITTVNSFTVYARWEPLSYKVSFVSDGSSISPITVVYDRSYGMLPVPSRTGYVFGGWYQEQSFQRQVTKDTIVKTAGNHTLYAKWIAATYMVSFVGNGGKVDRPNMTVTYNRAYGNLPTPTRTGYVFAGWYLESTFQTRVTTSTLVSRAGNHTLYAKWAPATYVVSLICNGGQTQPLVLNVTYNQTYGKLPTPTRPGHTFEGWYAEAALKTRVKEDTVVKRAGDHTLYAKWTLNQYTIVFDAMGGKVSPASKKVGYGKPIGALPTPVRNGYIFKGWYTQKQQGERYSSNKVLYRQSAITLYARWEQINVKALKVSGVKSAYNVNDTIPNNKLTVMATLSTGKTTQVKSGYQVHYNNKKVGTQAVIVTYKGVQWKGTTHWFDKKALDKATRFKAKTTLYIGENRKIGIDCSKGLQKMVSFKSKNANIASVDRNGKVVPKKVGKTQIKITYTINGKKTTFTKNITVKQPSISISWKQSKGKLFFRAKTKGCKNVRWSSSNKKVGVIDKKTGVFTAKKTGTTYVTASAGNVKVKVKIVVKNGMFACYHV